MFLITPLQLLIGQIAYLCSESSLASHQCDGPPDSVPHKSPGEASIIPSQNIPTLRAGGHVCRSRGVRLCLMITENGIRILAFQSIHTGSIKCLFRKPIERGHHLRNILHEDAAHTRARKEIARPCRNTILRVHRPIAPNQVECAPWRGPQGSESLPDRHRSGALRRARLIEASRQAIAEIGVRLVCSPGLPDVDPAGRLEARIGCDLVLTVRLRTMRSALGSASPSLDPTAFRDRVGGFQCWARRSDQA